MRGPIGDQIFSKLAKGRELGGPASGTRLAAAEGSYDRGVLRRLGVEDRRRRLLRPRVTAIADPIPRDPATGLKFGKQPGDPPRQAALRAGHDLATRAVQEDVVADDGQAHDAPPVRRIDTPPAEATTQVAPNDAPTPCSHRHRQLTAPEGISPADGNVARVCRLRCRAVEPRSRDRVAVSADPGFPDFDAPSLGGA